MLSSSCKRTAKRRHGFFICRYTGIVCVTCTCVLPTHRCCPCGASAYRSGDTALHLSLHVAHTLHCTSVSLSAMYADEKSICAMRTCVLLTQKVLSSWCACISKRRHACFTPRSTTHTFYTALACAFGHICCHCVQLHSTPHLRCLPTRLWCDRFGNTCRTVDTRHYHAVFLSCLCQARVCHYGSSMLHVRVCHHVVWSARTRTRRECCTYTSAIT